ncbi:hypothetical protein MBLNU457_3403t1 [Dothideomycetes sp. NU457]
MFTAFGQLAALDVPISGRSFPESPITHSLSKRLRQHDNKINLSSRASTTGTLNCTTSSTPILDQFTDYWHSLLGLVTSQSVAESAPYALATAAFVFILMSWSSRLGQWSGRFSPFGRSGTTEGVPQVSENDYSYITSDDLKRGDYDDKSGPPRETDVIVLKSKKVSYPVHFAAYSLDRGELTIGHVREQAAKKTGTSDPSRIKLLYRGKNLKDDTRACRAEGLKVGAEIMCTIADPLQDDDDDDESESEAEAQDGADGDKPKRKRNRTRNKKKKGKRQSEPAAAAESLPIPSAEVSRTPTPKPTVPATPMEKLNACQTKMQEMMPLCDDFLKNPPSDRAKRDFEHKKLSETILQQVLLKLDAVESDEPDVRAKRKELVKETQRILNSLDESVK